MTTAQAALSEAATQQTDRLLPWPQVRSLIGDLGRSTVWRMIGRGEFPAPVQTSPGRKAWWESDVRAWMERRRSAEPQQSAA